MVDLTLAHFNKCKISHSLSSNEPLVSHTDGKTVTHYFLVCLYIPPVVFCPSTVLEISFHCVSKSQHVMVRLRSQHEYSNVCHRVPSSWMTGEGHVLEKKKKKKSRDKQDHFCLSHLPFCFVFFLNPQCIWFQEEALSVYKHKADGNKSVTLCICVLSFFVNAWYTRNYLSPTIYVLKKKQWLNLYDLMLFKFFFLTFFMQSCFSFKTL